MTLTDSSVDDGPDGDMLPGDGNSTLRISVDWGDLTTKSFGSQGGSFSHTYTKTGTFTVTHTATDSRNQTGSEMCGPATPHYFTISGTVRNHAGAPLAGAAVTVKIGTTVVKTVTTASNGTFTTGATMKPASYTLTVTKSGYTFPVTGPQAVGPDWTGIIITANN
jgi:hypothetical protein